MLRHLHIENYAIIQQLDLELAESLNIITGETGAGKSILLGALGLLSGQRAEVSSIKDGEKSCIVEGTFDIDGYGLESLFVELELDYESQITIRRVIQNSGKSRAFVGDMPVTLAVLRTLSESLIDIHSQHQTLLLSKADFQSRILDSTAQTLEKLEGYKADFQVIVTLRKEIETLKEDQLKSEQERDYITYQIEQLREAKIQKGEQAELENELDMLQHSEEIAGSLGQASMLLDSDEGGVIQEVKSAIAQLHRIEGNYTEAEQFSERLNSCYLELKDIADELSSRATSIESNPRRLEYVEERLSEIYSLSKKYRVENGDDLLEILTNFETQLEMIEGSSHKIEEKEKELEKIIQKAETKANKIREARLKAAPKFEKHIVDSLKLLGMQTPKLQVEVLKDKELGVNGWDKIKFLFSANPGSAPQEIESVASGGEMARLMLSIKELVASKLKLPTVIFDEIDTGVSGAVADAMGEIIQKMSSSMQIINITHLPQVAAKGDNHYKVSKGAKGTQIQKLSSEQRKQEIAAMLSGAVITEAALNQAQELLQK